MHPASISMKFITKRVWRVAAARFTLKVALCVGKRREMDLMKLMMSDWKVELINDSVGEFTVVFKGPSDSEQASALRFRLNPGVAVLGHWHWVHCISESNLSSLMNLGP